MKSSLPAALALLLSLCAFAPSTARAEVTFDWATVGDTGNSADASTGYGAVSYSYKISKTEVTVAQYVEFLNAVDPDGLNTHGLFFEFTSFVTYNPGASAGSKYEVPPDSGNRPIADISWNSAARFINWLHNGQGTGDTESGVYDMTQETPSREPSGAYFLPTIDEWYKASYYQPTANGGDADGYWLYAVASNTLAGNIIGVADSANFYDNVSYAWDNNPLIMSDYFSDVGAFGVNSSSYYGTFDQGGNVSEWLETTDGDIFRLVAGGTYNSSLSGLESTADLFANDPVYEFDNSAQGFRVAAKDNTDPFNDWGGDILAYGIGGALSPGATSETPAVTVSVETLRLTAVIRTDDPRVTVEGEAVDTLVGTWSTAGVTSTTEGVDQSGVSSGFERRQFSVPLSGSKKFLRLRATLTP